MTYTTNQLISDAYYASGIVSREFETVSGSQIDNGLTWLNEIIGKKVADPELIPYENQLEFTAVIGQEEYPIPNLIKVNTLTFLKDNVRYAMIFMPRNQYHGRGRVETITTLPNQYFFERELGGAKISIYFLPNEPYVFTITGIFRLANIALGQDLELTLDTFYTSYLKYALAEKICHDYSMPVPDGTRRELNEYQALISKQVRPLDLTLRKQSTLQNRPYLNWAWANLGRGYMP